MNRHDGTYAAVTYGVPGAVSGGRAVDLTGAAAIRFGDVFDLSGDAPYSLEAWVATRGGGGSIFDKMQRVGGGTPSLGWLFALEMPSARTARRSSSTESTSTIAEHLPESRCADRHPPVAPVWRL
jgi:hypothetical protein